MEDMETMEEKARAKAIEFLERKDYNVVQVVDDNIVICEEEDFMVVCRVRYVTDKYEQDPTREECERIMCSAIMDLNIDGIVPVRFDEIQILDLGNGHALLRHHTNAANNQEN